MPEDSFVEMKEARFILALLLVIATTLMCGYVVYQGNYDALKTIMSTFGVLTASAITYYFGSKK